MISNTMLCKSVAVVVLVALCMPDTSTSEAVRIKKKILIPHQQLDEKAEKFLQVLEDLNEEINSDHRQPKSLGGGGRSAGR